MTAIDFILNCACLLLWLNWRSGRIAAIPRAPGIALTGTIRRAGRASGGHWVSLAVLGALVFLRAFLYWQVGPGLQWTPQLSLAGLVLHFRADDSARMLAFSVLGFLRILGAFYFSLLLLAALNRDGTAGPWNALVRAHLGIFARVPPWLAVLLPVVCTFLFWLLAGPLLAAMQVHAPLRSFGQLLLQSGIIGLEGWRLCLHALAAIVLLHVISSYVYLGAAPLWNYVSVTAQRLLQPFRMLPLRTGKIDLAPVAALTVFVLLVVFAPSALAWLYKTMAA